MNLSDEIRSIVSMEIPLDRSGAFLSDDDDLTGMGLDSMAFISIVVSIEHRFGIEFPDDKLIISKTNTIGCLCEIVDELLCRQEGGVSF